MGFFQRRTAVGGDIYVYPPCLFNFREDDYRNKLAFLSQALLGYLIPLVFMTYAYIKICVALYRSISAASALRGGDRLA